VKRLIISIARHETPRRQRQFAAWVRYKASWHFAHDERRGRKHYFDVSKKLAPLANKIICADSRQDTRDAAAHMLRVYRELRQTSHVTKYLTSIRFIADRDDGRDLLQDPVVFHDLGVLKDAEQIHERAGDSKNSGLAFDICSEAFHECIDMAMELVDLILIERSERLQEKFAGRTPPDGLRVQSKSAIDRYPHFLAEGPLTGTVVDHGDMFVVKVDQHIPGGEEWDNEVSYCDLVEHFWDEWAPIKETA
jgi:hypothetical protein